MDSDRGEQVPRRQDAVKQSTSSPATQDTPMANGGFYRQDTASVSPDTQAGGGVPPGTHLSASTSGAAAAARDQAGISWMADGDIAHAHARTWRARMIGLSLLLGAVTFLITGFDWVSAGSVVFAGLLFGLFGSRRTQGVNYQVDTQGIRVGARRYGYGEFRAFSVFEDRAAAIVELIPLKRFMPVILLHLDQQQAGRIVEFIAQRLPMQPHHRDLMDRITSRIKI